MSQVEKLRIGTRGSRLALSQTNLVMAELQKHHSVLRQPGTLELVVIKLVLVNATTTLW